MKLLSPPSSAAPRRLALCALILITLASLLAHGTTGRPQTAPSAGSLDQTFGGGSGRVTTGFERDSGASAVAVQPDGKIAVAGTVENDGADFAVVRYNPDGDMDSSFGTGGKVVTDFGGADRAYALALQPDGRIVVAGTSAGQGFALARYQPDGGLDQSFGAGGRVTTSLPGAEARAVAVWPDGKIVAAGFTKFPSDFALARYNPDGSPDATFGVGGRVTTDLFGDNDSAYAMAPLPDGRIVVGGFGVGADALDPFQYSLALVRYNTDGSLDASFGRNGKATTRLGLTGERVVGLALQPDGKLVGAAAGSGSVDGRFYAVRFTADGRQLDAGFGSGGRVEIGFPDARAKTQAIALQSNGKILVAGFAQPNAGPALDGFALARLNPDGQPDAGFGAGGRVTTDFGGSPDQGRAVAAQPDGRIVVAGDALGAPTPTPTPTPSPTPTPLGDPIIVTDEGTSRAVALDSVTHARDSFWISNTRNFSADRRTRVMLFTTGVRPDASPSAVSVVIDTGGEVSAFPTVEYVGAVPGQPQFTAVVFRLDAAVQMPFDIPVDVRIKLIAEGVASNTAVITVGRQP